MNGQKVEEGCIRPAAAVLKGLRVKRTEVFFTAGAEQDRAVGFC